MDKLCPRCETVLPLEAFPPNRARHKGRAAYCRPCQMAANDEYQRRLRLDAIELLGGACVGCGISDSRVLCFDHVNGGGSEARRSGQTRQQVYRLILGGDPGFQLLCWNCNHLKRLQEGEHVGTRVYPRSVTPVVTETVTVT